MALDAHVDSLNKTLKTTQTNLPQPSQATCSSMWSWRSPVAKQGNKPTKRLLLISKRTQNTNQQKKQKLKQQRAPEPSCGSAGLGDRRSSGASARSTMNLNGKGSKGAYSRGQSWLGKQKEKQKQKQKKQKNFVRPSVCSSLLGAYLGFSEGEGVTPRWGGAFFFPFSSPSPCSSSGRGASAPERGAGIASSLGRAARGGGD